MGDDLVMMLPFAAGELTPSPTAFGPRAPARFPTARPDMQFLCIVPSELGAPTGLAVRNGKVVCRTESGVDMIVPSKAPAQQ